MKRMWLGIALLAILAVGGLLISREMRNIHDPISRDLSVAAQAAQEDDWDRALALYRQAESRWEKKWSFTASMAHHEPMEQIDALFAQLGVYSQARDPLLFAACCAQLSSMARAAGEGSSLSWWNLL